MAIGPRDLSQTTLCGRRRWLGRPDRRLGAASGALAGERPGAVLRHDAPGGRVLGHPSKTFGDVLCWLMILLGW